MHREEIYPFAPSKKNQFLLFIHNPPERETFNFASRVRLLPNTYIGKKINWPYIILIAQILKGSVWTHIDNSVWKYRLTVQKNSSNLYVSCFAEGSVDGLIRKCKFSNCSNANVKRARIVFVTEQFCRHVGRQSDKNCFPYFLPLFIIRLKTRRLLKSRWKSFRGFNTSRKKR